MTAGDGATTDFGEEERLRRTIDRTPRRPTDLCFSGVARGRAMVTHSGPG
jgi:hypothetical protein